jgi:hypothetical protein
VESSGLRVLPIARVIELQLASGISAPHRLRDLADGQELIRTRGLDDSLAQELDPSIRPAYLHLWRAVRDAAG